MHLYAFIPKGVLFYLFEILIFIKCSYHAIKCISFILFLFKQFTFILFILISTRMHSYAFTQKGFYLLKSFFFVNPKFRDLIS